MSDFRDMMAFPYCGPGAGQKELDKSNEEVQWRVARLPLGDWFMLQNLTVAEKEKDKDKVYGVLYQLKDGGRLR
jgi:hypothetical protein